MQLSTLAFLCVMKICDIIKPLSSIILDVCLLADGQSIIMEIIRKQNMKKYIAILLILFFAVSMPQKSQAFGDFIKPTSPLYFLQSWKESLGMFFSFSNEKKLDNLQELSEKRVSELRDFGKSDAQTVQMLAKKYENNYREMERIALQMENKNQVAEKIKNSSIVQQETLARVYEQVPEKSQTAILNAQENSSKNVSAVLEKFSPEKKAEYEQKVQQIQQMQKIQLMEKARIMEKESGNENGDPKNNNPNPLNEIKKGNDLNQTKNENSLNETNAEPNQDSGEKMQPAAPAQMQSPASKN